MLPMSTDPMSVAVALDTMERVLDALLVLPNALEAEALPPVIARTEGRLKDQPITLETRLFSGRGHLARLHVARGRGAMESLTVIALPAATEARPIFSVDIVAFGGRFAVMFLDLCAVGRAGSFRAGPAASASRVALLEHAGVASLPDFCQGITSEHAIFARGAAATSPDSAETPARLTAAFLSFAVAFADSLAQEAEPDPNAQVAQADFLRRMVENKREARALARLFGEEWSERFLGEHFFAMPKQAQAIGAAEPKR